MASNLAYQSIACQFNSLQHCGYYKISSDSPGICKYFHKIYRRFCLIWIIAYSVQELLKMFMVREDKEKLISVLFLFLTHTDSIYKQTVFWFSENEIEDLLNTIKVFDHKYPHIEEIAKPKQWRRPIFNKDLPETRKFILTITRHGYLLLRSDNYSALITCFLWALLLVLRHADHKPTEFGFWIPFDCDTDLRFYTVTLYSWLTTSWQGFGNTTMDVTISFLFAQGKIQIRILRTEIANLVQRCKDTSEKTGDPYEVVLKNNFNRLIHHHKKILEFVQRVDKIFSGAIFYQFLVAGSILCTSIYRMVNMQPLSIEFFSMTAYMYCILIEVFLYCYYGSELTSESEMLLGSVYSMDWVTLDASYRKNVCILMERVKRPIRPLAGNVISISNDTFVRIVKSSYSLFTLLKATNE